MQSTRAVELLVVVAVLCVGPWLGGPDAAAAQFCAGGIRPVWVLGARDQLDPRSLDQRLAIRMWRLTLTLQLDQASAGRVFPLMRNFDDREQELWRARLRLQTQLEREVAALAPRPLVLEHLIERLLENGQARRSLDVERFEAVRVFLTVAQQAKFLRFWQRQAREPPTAAGPTRRHR